jgi:hypothetical protein
MDKLEEQIRKNREDLDRYRPSSQVWRKINRRINNKRFATRQALSIAAMFIVILGTSVVLIRSGLLHTGSAGIKTRISKEESGNSQLKETEIYYNNLVNSLYREAKPMLTGNPEIQKELTSDISHIDSICLEIKRDLKDNVANQDVVEALIQNYRIKIQILEEMLSVLKEDENNPAKEKSHEL